MTRPLPESQAIEYRRRYRGLIGVRSKVQVRDSTALSLVYTPGVAEPCLEIARNPRRSFDVTCRGNTIAIVSDGSAAFGMGDIGPEAILPVLESKAVIMKNFSGVDALPLALEVADAEAFIETVLNLGVTFGAISIEDVASPASLTITSRLQQAMNIPVINNHREGVSIGVLAGLLNAGRLVGKDVRKMRVVINGAGAAGLGTAFLLYRYGARNVIVCDRQGAIYKYRPLGMNWAKWAIAQVSNPDGQKGALADVLKRADAYIGYASGAEIHAEQIGSMAAEPILFTFGSPIEIEPQAARAAGAAVVATAHSTFPNQMDISSVVPGVFRGLLDVRASYFSIHAQLAAAEAIAGIIGDDELHPDYIYPHVIDYRVAPAVAEAVARVSQERGQAKNSNIGPEEISERTQRFVYEGKLPVPPKSNGSLSVAEESLELHDRFQGLLEIYSKVPVKDEHILNLFYLNPGAMEPARLIADNRKEVFNLTARSNLVGVVSDGSAVLGLGNIGGRAALPVMEGKAILFHTFAGVEAFPICVNTQDPDEIIEIVKRLEPTFGGINLEDISAPRCFYIEKVLREQTDIPIFHDDQHGTAVVVLAGILNACRLLDKQPAELSIAVNGAGASAVAVTKLLMAMGVEDVIMVDTTGIIYEGRQRGMNWIKEEMAQQTNAERLKGDLSAAVNGRDVFIGLSVPGVLTGEMIRTMASKPIIFALANPTPEIMPDEAIAAGAGMVATGRSDLPNQVNNSLAFPGIFRGALDTRVRNITDEMKIAAAHAIAELVTDRQLQPDYIIPRGTDYGVAPAVAEAVARKAIESGEARVHADPMDIAARLRQFIYEERD
ncbi:MAG: malic enzyme-like NAD(P)-binding protein [Candidatus Promineifilaceae bacterium]|nr:malic enzyme-like NAD(P)-binding protein [Candidatus Promineifilaceae bacterium]